MSRFSPKTVSGAKTRVWAFGGTPQMNLPSRKSSASSRTLMDCAHAERDLLSDFALRPGKKYSKGSRPYLAIVCQNANTCNCAPTYAQICAT